MIFLLSDIPDKNNRLLKKSPQIILGIDPGTIIMGYGLIAVNGQKLQLLHMDVLKLNAKKDQHTRLELIHRKVSELIREFHPTTFAIEAPFFGKNVQSMLKLGRAQGVAIAAAIQAGLEVCEYSPKKVKQAITGNGNADKQQVWSMLQRIVTIEEKPDYLDASDALAVAICHHYQTSSPIPGGNSKLKGWEDFLKKNEHRIRKPV